MLKRSGSLAIGIIALVALAACSTPCSRGTNPPEPEYQQGFPPTAPVSPGAVLTRSLFCLTISFGRQ